MRKIPFASIRPRDMIQIDGVLGEVLEVLTTSNGWAVRLLSPNHTSVNVVAGEGVQPEVDLVFEASAHPANITSPTALLGIPHPRNITVDLLNSVKEKLIMLAEVSQSDDSLVPTAALQDLIVETLQGFLESVSRISFVVGHVSSPSVGACTGCAGCGCRKTQSTEGEAPSGAK